MRSHFLRLTLACLWCWATLIPLRAIPLWVFAGSGASSPAYDSAAAEFDGTNDFIRRTGETMTNIADSNVGTISFWLDIDGGDGTLRRVLEIGDTITLKCAISLTTSNTIQVFLRSSGGTTRLDMSGDSTLLASGGWVHVFVVIDLVGSTNSNNKIYIDGVRESETYTTNADGSSSIDWVPATPRYTIGANGTTSSPGNKLTGKLAEFYFFNTEHDIPGEFRNGSRPADLGATGNGSSAGTPDIYLSRSGSGNSWATDSSGNGNTFTVTGALGSPTPP